MLFSLLLDFNFKELGKFKYESRRKYMLTIILLDFLNDFVRRGGSHLI